MQARKQLRLEHWDYSENGVYFITICTKNRKQCLSRFVGNGFIRSHAGSIAEQQLLALPTHFPHISVDCYVIMPNHIHLLLRIDQSAWDRINLIPTISTVVGTYKAGVSRVVGFPLWQKSFYDHIIRNEQDYLEIRTYIENNPLKWELDRFYSDDL